MTTRRSAAKDPLAACGAEAPRPFSRLLLFLLSALLPVLVSTPLLVTPAAAKDSHFSRHVFERDGRQLEVLISAGFKPAMRENLLQWVDYIASTLREVYGHWPRKQWQISIESVSAGDSDPIPWAQVHRGDIDRVEFFTTPYASTETMRGAWTGYHELAHLLIPYRGWGDAWFSEGLASYYQNILQARAGVIGERTMWQKLYDGFQRGLAQTRFDGQPLRAVSDELRENGGFMRVYWSGAWYFLAADTSLRLRSGGGVTLDTALKRLNECCAEQHLSVPDIVSRLDRLNHVQLFRTLYDKVSASTAVPSFEDIFATLGIDVTDGEVFLQQDGPGARLRGEMLSVNPAQGREPVPDSPSNH